MKGGVLLGDREKGARKEVRGKSAHVCVYTSVRMCLYKCTYVYIQVCVDTRNEIKNVSTTEQDDDWKRTCSDSCMPRLSRYNYRLIIRPLTYKITEHKMIEKLVHGIEGFI